jgi:LysM repeat protein
MQISQQKRSTHQKNTERHSSARNPNLLALWVTVGLLVVLLPLIALSGTLIVFQTFKLNLPGVHIFDKNVGLMTLEQTVAWTDHIWNENRQIIISHPTDPSIQYFLHPEELGFWVDPNATAQAAYQYGRGTDPLGEISTLIRENSITLLPVLYFDPETANQTLHTIAGELTVPAINARVAFQDGQWIAVPGSEGLTVDVEATSQSLYENAFSSFISGQATLIMKPLQPEINDMSAVLAEINAVAARELQLEAYDPILDETLVWSVPLEIKQNWISVDPDNNEVTLEFDRSAIEAFLTSWQNDLGEGRSLSVPPDLDDMIQNWENGLPMHTTILHNPTTYLVKPGDSLWSISLNLGIPMWYIMDANEGLTTHNLEAGMNLTIPSRNVLLPLPVVEEKRIKIDISEQRMYVFEEGQLIDTHIISTGVEDSPTMAGIFQVQTHEINAYASNWDLYMPHFMGIYEAWPGFMNGIHGLPLLSSGQRLWAGNLGSPVSYGCIILDLDAAEALYDWAEAGVVVEITP